MVNANNEDNDGVQEARPTGGNIHVVICSVAQKFLGDGQAPQFSADDLSSSATAHQLGTQTLYVVLGNIFTLAVGLPLQIYVARVIGTVGLGIYGLVDGAIFTANGFLNLGVAPTMVRFIPAYLERREYGAVRRLLRLGAVILLAVGGISYGLFLLALPRLEDFWSDLADHRYVIATMAVVSPLALLMYFLQQALRGFREIRYMVLGSSVMQLTTKAAATVAAFAVGLRLEGYVAATVLANLVGVLWMAWGLKRSVDRLPADGAEPTAPPLPQWRRYATICYSNSLLGAATARLDRFTLGAFVDSSTVGVLVVVNQLQQLPQLFYTMLSMVGAPMFAAAHSRDATSERDHLYALMTDWVVKASLPLILFLMLFAHPVLALFGPAFADRGTGVLRLLLLAQIVGLASGPVGTVAMMGGLEHMFLRLSAVQTIIQAILIVSLAVPFGLFGVAIATASGAVFTAASLLIVVRLRLGLRWWNKRYLGWLAPAAVSAGLGLAAVYAGFPLGAVSLAVILFAIYASFALVLYIQGLHDDERDLLRDIASRLVARHAE